MGVRRLLSFIVPELSSRSVRMLIDMRRRLGPPRRSATVRPVRVLEVNDGRGGQEGWVRDTIVYGGVVTFLCFAACDSILELGLDGLAFCAVMVITASPFAWLAVRAYRRRVQPSGFDILPAERK